MKIQVRFDGPPGPVAGRFVGVEDETGARISVGEWKQDGRYWLLLIDTEDVMSPSQIRRAIRGAL